MATTTALAKPEERTQRLPLAPRDKLTIGLLAFFVLIAWTIEAYWVLHNDSMEGRHDLLARALALYWPADRTYRIAGHGSAKSFTLALETVNSFVTSWLQLWLIAAIVRRKHYRHVLQLTVATYTFYGTFLYYYVAHLSGYAVFEYRGAYPFAMFYGANAPWLLGYAWLMYDSIRALTRKLRQAASAAA
jgi:hypothetical protein